MNAPIEVLLSRLDGVRQVRSNQWMSRCPHHNGDGTSLSIKNEDNGYILLYCFAHECEAGDILSAVGMTVSDLFPERLSDRTYRPAKHAVPATDVLRVMKHELTVVEILISDFYAGTLDFAAIDRALICAQRLQKALDLCSA
jgi:hypothetical protein